MGKFDGVLLASDFDNTLIYTEPALLRGDPIPPLSQGNREALEYFIAAGGRFAISTGRALAAISRIMPGLPANAPCVVCNGAAIYDFAAEEYLHFALLDETALQRGQQILDRFPSTAVEAYHIGNVIHAVRPNIYTRRHEHMTQVKTEEQPSLSEVPLPLGKLLFEDEYAVLTKIRAMLEEEGWARDYEIVNSGKTLLELTARGADKGSCVLRLAELLGIRREHVYCVGDEANDIPMLRIAAEGFAPANCIESVRACGATVVSHAEQDALADVVRILDARY